MDNATQSNDQTVIMYAHNTCPDVPLVLGIFKQAKVNYNYINIHEDEDARQTVREINDGYESVPTLIFPDGSTLTEPPAGVLREKLQSMGYTVPITALLIGNAWRILQALIIIYAILSFFEVI